MGDLRNKFAKIERVACDKETAEGWLRRYGIDPNLPPSPSRELLIIVCRAV
jgi:hypothetical protein